MAIEVFNRHESKFVLDADAARSLQTVLSERMEMDAYNARNSLYRISNIYFDTPDNHLIRTSLSKPRYKEKLRLRGYGVPGEHDKVFLEIKKKVCGVVNKRRTALYPAQAYAFVETGRIPDYKPYMNQQVLEELSYLIELYRPLPKLYLTYERMALVGRGEEENLRVTFDTAIRTRRHDLKLEAGCYGEELLRPGQWLMEIKCGASVPLWLARLLSEYKAYKTSFSKYGTEYKQMLAALGERKEEAQCLKVSSALHPTHPFQLSAQY